MCEHKSRRELHQGVLYLQKCMECGMIREYNPKVKARLVTSDPDLWSEWCESNVYTDKLFK